MTGTNVRTLDPLPPVTRDEFVPPDHCSRHLEQTLELAVGRDLVRDTQAEAGRPAIDPVVSTLHLIPFFRRAAL